MFVSVIYLLVHKFISISLKECARFCAVAIKDGLPPAPARYDHNSIGTEPKPFNDLKDRAQVKLC